LSGCNNWLIQSDNVNC